MEDKKSTIKAGLFVVFGVFIFIGSVLIFGSDQKIFSSVVRYKVKFKSTQGLSSGSVVTLSGLPVGHVENIEFSNDDFLDVILKIDEAFASRITEGAQATVRTQGALGDKYIYISAGQKSGQVIKPDSYIPSDNEPDILDVFSSKSSSFDEVFSIIRELNILLQNLNGQGKSAAFIENVVNASQSVSILLGEPSIKESFVHLRNILKKVDSGQGSLGRLINEPALYEQLTGILGDAPRNTYLKPLLREAIRQNEQQR